MDARLGLASPAHIRTRTHTHGRYCAMLVVPVASKFVCVRPYRRLISSELIRIVWLFDSKLDHDL